MAGEKDPPVGCECNQSALVLRGKCRVDTWETGNVPPLFHSAWQARGIRRGLGLPVLCRICVGFIASHRRRYSISGSIGPKHFCETHNWQRCVSSQHKGGRHKTYRCHTKRRKVLGAETESLIKARRVLMVA